MRIPFSIVHSRLESSLSKTRYDAARGARKMRPVLEPETLVYRVTGRVELKFLNFI